MSRTIYHLLWSDLEAHPEGNGELEPTKRPAVGLPFRLAAFMLKEALNVKREVVWSFEESVWKKLRESRRAQLEGTPNIALSEVVTAVLSHVDISWAPQFPRHAAYELPLARGRQIPADWVNALLFLTAATGDESILDLIFNRAPASIELSDRWKLRSQIPMPVEVWEWVDAILKGGRNGTFRSDSIHFSRERLTDTLAEMFDEAPLVMPDDFIAERIDVSLAEANTPEYPCAVSRRTLFGNATKERFKLKLADLSEDFIVRIAQTTEIPGWTALPGQFPFIPRKETEKIRRQFLRIFPTSNNDGSKWDIAVFPEVFLPPKTIKSFERAVRQSARAGLAGCIWREIPNAMRSYGIQPRPTHLANEALLVVPVGEPHPGNRKTRSFYVRKPLPTHIEQSFVKRLNFKRGSDDVRLLPGRRIYRFVHPKWGDFTVAICSDLIDPILWTSLRGQVLHLLSCAYNKDVNLFDALTWVRAYEMCANIVATNCGQYGGSFAWSPKIGENKELARIRGNDLLVTADISLPVKSLAKWQEEGIEKAVNRGVGEWMTKAENRGLRKSKEEFKAPPPGFPQRKFWSREDDIPF